MNRLAPKQPDREWGDFQTPVDLARRVCAYLTESGVAPDVVIEPTFGVGNFITAALQTFPTIQRVYGVEINRDYVEGSAYHVSRNKLSPQQIELHCDSIFTHAFPKNLNDARHLLIIGNPPWVTNAEIGSVSMTTLFFLFVGFSPYCFNCVFYIFHSQLRFLKCFSRNFKRSIKFVFG